MTLILLTVGLVALVSFLLWLSSVICKQLHSVTGRRGRQR